MNDIRVVISGSMTKEYEGGLYAVIDSYNLPADRDGVIDVFDTVAYYTNNEQLLADLPRWYALFLELRNHKGIDNVELVIGTEVDEEES